MGPLAESQTEEDIEAKTGEVAAGAGATAGDSKGARDGPAAEGNEAAPLAADATNADTKDEDLELDDDDDDDDLELDDDGGDDDNAPTDASAGNDGSAALVSDAKAPAAEEHAEKKAVDESLNESMAAEDTVPAEEQAADADGVPEIELEDSGDEVDDGIEELVAEGPGDGASGPVSPSGGRGGGQEDSLDEYGDYSLTDAGGDDDAYDDEFEDDDDDDAALLDGAGFGRKKKKASAAKSAKASARAKRRARKAKRARPPPLEDSWDDDDRKPIPKELSEREKQAVAFLTRRVVPTISRVTQAYLDNCTFQPEITERSRVIADQRGEWEVRREKYLSQFVKKRAVARKGTLAGAPPKGCTFRPKSMSDRSRDLVENRENFHSRYEKTFKAWLRARGGEAKGSSRRKKRLTKEERKEREAKFQSFLKRNYKSKGSTDSVDAGPGMAKTEKSKLDRADAMKRFLARYEADLAARDSKMLATAAKVCYTSEAHAKLRKLEEELGRAKSRKQFEKCLRIEARIEDLRDRAEAFGREQARRRKDDVKRAQERRSQRNATGRRARLLRTLQEELTVAMEENDFVLCLFLRREIDKLGSDDPRERASVDPTSPRPSEKRKERFRATITGRNLPPTPPRAPDAPFHERMAQDLENRRRRQKRIDRELAKPARTQRVRRSTTRSTTATRRRPAAMQSATSRPSQRNVKPATRTTKPVARKRRTLAPRSKTGAPERSPLKVKIRPKRKSTKEEKVASVPPTPATVDEDAEPDFPDLLDLLDAPPSGGGPGPGDSDVDADEEAGAAAKLAISSMSELEELVLSGEDGDFTVGGLLQVV